MIVVVMHLGQEEELLSVSASGHSRWSARGTDIVCAAVTILLRTTLSVLSKDSTLMGENPSIRAESEGRGLLSFSIQEVRPQSILLLQYAASFLIDGLLSLEKEYKGFVELRVERKK